MSDQVSFLNTNEEPMHDARYMTAAEKQKVLLQWETFLKSGCARDRFTESLYKHLINHCSFIAHYDINGFYSTYFIEGEDTVRFLSQFDNRNGIPKSIEYGMTYWYRDPDYHDLNSAMCRVAAKYIPLLVQQANKRQREADIARAQSLLAKHGIKADIEE